MKEPQINLLKFDGMLSKFWGFFNQICFIIQLHQQCYLDDRTQVGFIGTFLSNMTLTWFATFLERQSPFLNNFETIIDEFGASFGNINKKHIAVSKLWTFFHWSCPTFMYVSKFKQLTCDISWHKIALMNQFQFGLRGDVKDLMLTMFNPTTLSQAITQVVHCDN